MELAEITDWYSKFTDTNINADLIKHMKKIGMVDDDIDLDTFNSFMLMKDGNEYVINSDGRYVVKESRKNLNNSFSQKNVGIPLQNTNTNKKPLKFKIEKTGNKKLKLVKN